MNTFDPNTALGFMQHAVGYNDKRTRKAVPYRNYFAANTGGDDARTWDVLCALGLAVKGQARRDDSGLTYYHVSEAGLALLKKRTVKPCKETR